MAAGQHNRKKLIKFLGWQPMFSSAIFFILFVLIFFGNFKGAAGASSSTPAIIAKKTILQSVPFTSQSPLGEWLDERQQDGCEEAVSLMAMAWVKKEPSMEAKVWREKILTLSDFEQKKYGEYRDTSLSDIVDRIFKDYVSYDRVKIKSIDSVDDIILELEAGRLVLIPANGQALHNPNFKAPGPERHMVLIKGYDYQTEEFITNDPGTRKGENYRYPKDIIFTAIRPYKTGYHEEF
jgi:ABC-type amino acid transport substrate-binding protein